MSGSKVRISTAPFERRPYFGAQQRCHILYFVFTNPEKFHVSSMFGSKV